LVQSIVRLTRASDISAYTTAVEGRIRALSRAHTILSLSRWQGADMRGLVEEELAPYRTGETAKVETSGPNVSLQPAAAQSLALALHELVTNAAKYGALSSMSGRVHLAWELNPGTLVLKWTESGGPATQVPSSPALARGSSPPASKASLPARPYSTGVLKGCDASCQSHATTWRRSRATTGKRPRYHGRSVVQSDHSCGQSRHDRRGRGAGCDGAPRVLGRTRIFGARPFSRISEAMIALRNNRIDAAVLDVNLGGELIYPLADVLAADHVPFVFITGYGAEEIEPRYARVPVLQKPIEVDALEIRVRALGDDPRCAGDPAPWRRSEAHGIRR
jgi:hypothetical protein